MDGNSYLIRVFTGPSRRGKRQRLVFHFQDIDVDDLPLPTAGSEGESSELPKHVLRKFGEAVRGDYSWWSDIVARQTRWQAIIASDEPYNEGRYRVLLVEWKRLQSEYRGYRQEVCVIASIVLFPVTD